MPLFLSGVSLVNIAGKNWVRGGGDDAVLVRVLLGEHLLKELVKKKVLRCSKFPRSTHLGLANIRAATSVPVDMVGSMGCDMVKRGLSIFFGSFLVNSISRCQYSSLISLVLMVRVALRSVLNFSKLLRIGG
jgi:hypothetical protein